MTINFTLKQYSDICRMAIDSGYHVLTIEKYIRDPNCYKNIIILRHDVDRKPINALKMAELEYGLGIFSTYYFRHVTNTYKPSIMQSIAGMGHEIGYHYETLSKSHGNYDDAILLFESELADFRIWIPVNTISMHGSPLSPFNNRDLWKKYDFKKFDLLGEAYLSIDYQELRYFTDTSRTWQHTRSNLRDFTDEMEQDDSVVDSNDLMNILHQKKYPKICISAHSERWNSDIAGWIFSISLDLITNLAKTCLRLVRRSSFN